MQPEFTEKERERIRREFQKRRTLHKRSLLLRVVFMALLAYLWVVDAPVLEWPLKVALFVVIFGLLATQYRARLCPNCGRHMGRPHRIKYCPNCAAPLT